MKYYAGSLHADSGRTTRVILLARGMANLEQTCEQLSIRYKTLCIRICGRFLRRTTFAVKVNLSPSCIAPLALYNTDKRASVKSISSYGWTTWVTVVDLLLLKLESPE